VKARSHHKKRYAAMARIITVMGWWMKAVVWSLAAKTAIAPLVRRISEPVSAANAAKLHSVRSLAAKTAIAPYAR
jgi:hypothetical protein